MKKFISYMLVFIIGFAACAFILQRSGYDVSLFSGKQNSVLSNLTSRSAAPVIKKGENPIADAAELVGPAVVNIDTITERQVRVQDPISQFFGIPGGGGEVRKQQALGSGSGIIISKDGYILTNNHVVADAQKIIVYLKDGRKFDAHLISRDSLTEVAVIKVDTKGLPVAKLGNSDNIRVGDWAIAIGNPLRHNNTVTVGIISALGRNEEVPREGTSVPLKDLIQTDAAINPGNSGGALVNIHGEVIGINTMIATAGSPGNIGIGFAIPINSAKEVAMQMIEKGEVIRPWLGVYLGNLEGEFAAWYQQQGYKGNSGAVVMNVKQGSPAAKAGLMQKDIITGVDKTRLKNREDLVKIIGKSKIGKVIMLTVWREGETKLIAVKVGKMPPQQ